MGARCGTGWVAGVCSTAGNASRTGTEAVTVETTTAGSAGPGRKTRSVRGGSTGRSTAVSSMAAVVRVQTACRPAALRTRSKPIAAHAAAARGSERTLTSTRNSTTAAPASISVSFAGLAPRDPLRQPLQFLLVHHVVVHHAHQELLHRAAAEPLDDLPHRLGRHVLRPIQSGVNVGPAVHAVRHVAFLFQAGENRAGRRLLHRMPLRQLFADLLGRGRPAPPYRLHDEVFQRAQGLSVMFFAKHCSATKCSAKRRACQDRFLPGAIEWLRSSCRDSIHPLPRTWPATSARSPCASRRRSGVCARRPSGSPRRPCNRLPNRASCCTCWRWRWARAAPSKWASSWATVPPGWRWLCRRAAS